VTLSEKNCWLVRIEHVLAELKQPPRFHRDRKAADLVEEGALHGHSDFEVASVMVER
jgi:hypothetical protein